MTPGVRAACLSLLLSACGAPVGLVAETEELDVGGVRLGESQTVPVLLSNEGPGEVALLSVSLASGPVDAWSFQVVGSQVVRSPGDVSLRVTFRPLVEGEVTATARVLSWVESEGEQELLLRLSGVGIPPWLDRDGDGFLAALGDCDDSDPSVHPGAEERCDGVDTDCGRSGPLLPARYDGPVEDTDEDGDGVPACAGDCDDTDPRVHPGAPERCLPIDHDCDGVFGIEDADGDGLRGCDGDCDDRDPGVLPGAEESCNGADDDCDGETDELDRDGDGFSPCAPWGDCDDGDARASPRLVRAGVPRGGDGSPSAPFDTIDAALADLDRVCREVWVGAGEYAVAAALPEVPRVTIRGASAAGVLLRPGLPTAFDVQPGRLLELEDLTLGDAPANAVEVRGTLVGRRVRFFDNHRAAEVFDGGALVLTDSEVHRSAAGGVHAVGRVGLRFENTDWIDNFSGGPGGAVLLDVRPAGVDASIRVEGGTFRGNRSGREGGALSVRFAAASIRDARFIDNRAGLHGGGLFLLGTPHRGTAPQLTGVELLRNVAGGRGGGLFADVRSPQLRNVLAVGNAAGAEGGGAWSIGSPCLEVRNSTFVGNVSGGPGSGLAVGSSELYCEESAHHPDQVVASLLVDNEGGDGLWFDPAEEALSAAWTTVHGTVGGADFGGAADEQGLGNDRQDPLFTRWAPGLFPEAADLSLRAREGGAKGSPAIDSGPPGVDWSDCDGSRNDRGHLGGPFAACGEGPP